MYCCAWYSLVWNLSSEARASCTALSPPTASSSSSSSSFLDPASSSPALSATSFLPENEGGVREARRLGDRAGFDRVRRDAPRTDVPVALHAVARSATVDISARTGSGVPARVPRDAPRRTFEFIKHDLRIFPDRPEDFVVILGASRHETTPTSDEESIRFRVAGTSRRAPWRVCGAPHDRGELVRGLRQVSTGVEHVDEPK